MRTFNCNTNWLKNDSDLQEMGSYEQSLYEYTQLAICFDLEDPELKIILKYILEPVKDVFKDGSFLKPLKVYHYSAIIGPSFMGKTQLSFILARCHPVFYFNFFVDVNSPQNIYTCFSDYSDELLQTLDLDKKSLSETKNLTELSESGNLFLRKNLKLYTIGFIWSLIEHSLEFDFSINDGIWFYHYLKKRSHSYEALSFNDFYAKMGKILSLFYSYNLLSF